MSFLAKDANGTNQNLPLYDPAYSVSATIVPGAAPTTIFELKGVASVKTRIKRVELSLSGAVSTGTKVVQLNIRSTTASGGTAVTPTICQHDQSDAAPAAVARHWTAAPTAGTSLGIARSGHIGLATAQGVDRLVWEFTTRGDKPLVLSKATEFFTIDLATALEASQILAYSVQWEEGAV